MSPSSRIGKFEIGVIGIEEAMRELAAAHADRKDEDIAASMLGRIGRHSCIPPGTRGEYGHAFPREFRKFSGSRTRARLLTRLLHAGFDDPPRLAAGEPFSLTTES